ncbi:MAG: hypothetical protein FWC39_13305 [Bacteroidetes bacterium]|nr:hypothetical protein [Bacteroidota bacterium]
MTELVLKNRVSKQKLHSIVTFLQAWGIDAEVKNTHKRAVSKKIAPQKDPFADVWGMWEGREIDGKTLRKQAWGIE